MLKVFISKNEFQFTLTIWNPTIQPVPHMIRVPVTKDYTIRGPAGEMIEADVKFY